MRIHKISVITLVLFGAIAAFVLASSVFAGEHDPNSYAANSPVPLVSFADADQQRRGFRDTRNRRVRCDRGQSLARALRRARAHTTITVYGTCYESVVVTTDNLTIRGGDNAVIDGSQSPGEAVVLIDGARRFTLARIAVQNGSDQGILVTRQGQARLTEVTAQNNGTVGLSIDRSHVELVDSVLDNNGTGGMDAYSASTVLATGQLSASSNGGDGLAANGKTFFELRGATVVANQNLGTGVSIINDSRLQIFSFPEAQGSSVNADNNGFAGIGILGSELGAVGSQFFGSGANVFGARDNAVFGFFAPTGSIISPHATAKFIASGNGVGMLLEDGASILIVGGLDLNKNGAGLSAHGAGTLTIVSVPPNPSRIIENGIDFDLGFGTRMTSDQVEFASISCDQTVLTRGLECNQANSSMP